MRAGAGGGSPTRRPPGPACAQGVVGWSSGRATRRVRARGAMGPGRAGGGGPCAHCGQRARGGIRCRPGRRSGLGAESTRGVEGRRCEVVFRGGAARTTRHGPRARQMGGARGGGAGGLGGGGYAQRPRAAARGQGPGIGEGRDAREGGGPGASVGAQGGVGGTCFRSLRRCGGLGQAARDICRAAPDWWVVRRTAALVLRSRSCMRILQRSCRRNQLSRATRNPQDPCINGRAAGCVSGRRVKALRPCGPQPKPVVQFLSSRAVWQQRCQEWPARVRTRCPLVDGPTQKARSGRSWRRATQCAESPAGQCVRLGRSCRTCCPSAGISRSATQSSRSRSCR